MKLFLNDVWSGFLDINENEPIDINLVLIKDN